MHGMKTVLKIVLGLFLLLVLLGGGGYLWATGERDAVLARTYETHRVDFPIPVPLSPEEVASRGLTAQEAEEEALRRAVESGRHLAEARYGCLDCHGENLGGGIMMDAGPVALLQGPNLTLGQGGVTRDYTFSDWDRAVRHGVLPDGRGSVMPSEDYQRMSDQELSDLVAYIRSFPPVDNTVTTRHFGPVGTVLVARGQFVLSAERIGEHDRAHRRWPPEEAVSVEFGRHLAAVCVGCHMADYAGGDNENPSWPEAANLTPHEDGLAGWSYDDFRTALREGRSRDGRALQEPMTFVIPMANRMTDTELEAIWVFLQTLPPVADADG
jgi:mono/diheme cytochrome c family protein